MHSTQKPTHPRAARSVGGEKAVLVSVALPGRPWPGEGPFAEARGLLESAGAAVVGELAQKRQHVQPATYIGPGKLQELQALVEQTDADLVVFDNELSPAQGRNLEKALGVKVLDRTQVILDIFATRARTQEARLQVELAQLEYALPRLKNLWSHLSRQGVGGVGLRGPGEKQLEVDRRLAVHRVRELKRRLAEVQARKGREVRSRGEEHTVSLVGYTNAGKSTLMNALTGAGVHVEDRLFSTLDTRTRQWPLREGARALLSDTVGLIRDLPHHLVASFKATLEEARQARLLLHVIDASSPEAEEHVRAVDTVLEGLGCGGKPTILVLNKADRVDDPSRLHALLARHPRAVTISARTGAGLEALEDAVLEALSTDVVEAEVRADAGNGKLLAFLEAHAAIDRQELSEEGDEVVIRCRLPRHLLRHVEGPGVTVRHLDGQARPAAVAAAD